jgi:hypothetical protein
VAATIRDAGEKRREGQQQHAGPRAYAGSSFTLEQQIDATQDPAAVLFSGTHARTRDRATTCASSFASAGFVR